MKKLILVMLINSLISINAYCIDSLQIEKRLKSIESLNELNNKNLSNRIDEVRSNQLNYKIEKDLIREAYSVNFDRINMAITFILGVIGVFGFLGIRDINSIKKQFSGELESLSTLRNSFQSKVYELDATKEKYDKAFEEITQTNIDQNKKLQVIEIKEKINKCIRDNETTMAYEYCVVGLEITPNDVNLLRSKSIILSHLGRFNEQKKVLLHVLDIEPNNTSVKLDLIEAYIFNKEIENARKMMEDNKNVIDNKLDGSLLLSFFNMLISYIEDDFPIYKNKIITEISKEDLVAMSLKLQGWSLIESQYFIIYNNIPSRSDILKHYIWFLEGKMTGRNALDVITSINE